MKTFTMLAVCGLLAGCGSTDVTSAAVVSRLDSIPNYLIDANAGVSLYEDVYSITTNGTDWIVGWTGDATDHEFSGTVVVGGNITNVLANGFGGGDYVDQTDFNQIDFDALTDGSVVPYIQFTSDTVPVRFDLYVDGVPAVYQIVFSSANVEATTDAMPVDLTPGGAFRLRSLSPGKGGMLTASSLPPTFNKAASRPGTGSGSLRVQSAPAPRPGIQNTH